MLRRMLGAALLILFADSANAADASPTTANAETEAVFISELQQQMADNKRPSAERYFAVRKALDAGLVPPGHERSAFLQYYAFMATFVGAYDEASRRYNTRPAPEDVASGGFDSALPATRRILDAARGQRAVFFNESHGEVRSRAAIYPLLAPLRAQGYTHLALEALASTDPRERTPESCRDASILDNELHHRGYPISRSGYYTQEPVFAELVREALRLGFELVAYDSYVPGSSIAQREQRQADNLACLITSNPDARLVLIGGFSHIGESKDFWIPGGAMAYRFKVATGIDPLTISTTTLLGTAARDFSYPRGDSDTLFTLGNADGATYARPEFDWTVFVPGNVDRTALDESLLTLDGRRVPVDVPRRHCRGAFPCLIEARAEGESGDAVASDRCIIHSRTSRHCTLFLPQGRHRLITLDSDLKARQIQRISVRLDH